MVSESAGEQAEVHDARRRGETKAIGCDQAFVAVGTLHEFVAEPGAPLRSVCGSLRQGLKMQAAGVFAANFDGKSVVESQRRTEGQMESFFIFRPHAVVNCFAIGARWFFQDCS